MTTYVYATIPRDSADEPRYFEIKQSMKEPPLTVHPETGEPVRRVILGGLGIMGGAKADKQPAPRGGCCGGCGCGCR